MGTVDGPSLPLHTAGSFPTLLVERWRLVCAVSDSIPTGKAWHYIAKMLFPEEPVRWCTKRDDWLIKRYVLPEHFPDGMYYPGVGDDRRLAPEQLFVEVERAYFHLHLQNEVDRLFTERGFDLSKTTIPKHLFEAAVQAEFGQLPPEPVKPIEKAKAKQRKPKQPRTHQRYAEDDALVAEGRKGLKDGKYSNAWQAAQALAPRAKGSETGKVHRLHKKILSPRKISKHL